MLRCRVPVDVHTYKFDVRGQRCGQQVVRSDVRDGIAYLESEAKFEAPLSQATVKQLSRCDAADGTSFEYVESSASREGEHKIHVTFGDDDGLVTYRVGRDEASLPYLQPFRDPLSVIWALRRQDLAAEDLGDRIRVPMLGSFAEAHRIGTGPLDTELGRKDAIQFQIFPGGTRIWVDADPPHVVLAVRQRWSDGWMSATLTSVAREGKLSIWSSPLAPTVERKSTRKRKRRRRRGGERRRTKGGER